MSERDDQLRRVLREWKAPEPSARLDERIWKSYRPALGRKWLPIAAGLLLVAGLSMHLFSSEGAPRGPRTVSVKTTTDTSGFEPLPDGAITVVKQGEKQ